MPTVILKQQLAIQGNEQVITVTIDPPLPAGCKIASIFVKDTRIPDKPSLPLSIGNVTVTQVSKAFGQFSLRAPKNSRPVPIRVSVNCKGEPPIVRDLLVGLVNEDKSSFNPLDFIKDFGGRFIDWLKRAGGFLVEGITELLPKAIVQGLKDIKQLVQRGLDTVSNLIGVIPIPTPLGLIQFPDGLSRLKKKLEKHLMDLDPIDDSKEAALADAKALCTLIFEDIIPYVQEVMQTAETELRLYNQRLSVMNKMVDRLGQELDAISGRKRGGRRRKAT